jgi:hypothetical protein
LNTFSFQSPFYEFLLCEYQNIDHQNHRNKAASTGTLDYLKR